MTPTTGWGVTADGSVGENTMNGYSGYRGDMMPGYESHGFKVQTPVMRDCPGSFEHVVEVVAALVENHWVRVNASCGFHVHVGNGTRMVVDSERMPLVSSKTGKPVFHSRPFSLAMLKSVAQLHWAVDPFLCHLHPPERQLNPSCLSIRQHSALALGYLNSPGDNGYPPVRASPPAPEDPAVWKPAFPRASEKRFPAARPAHVGERAVMRLYTSMEPYCHALLEKPGSSPSYNVDADPIVNKCLRDGFAHIERCQTLSELATMLRSDATRTMNYNYGDYQRAEEELPLGKATVEYREAAGTLNPAWAVTWAQICVGIFRFACRAPRKLFREVLVRLARAEGAALRGEETHYDVISFLHDVGLPAQALYIEERLRHGDPLDHWYPCRLVFDKTLMPERAWMPGR